MPYSNAVATSAVLPTDKPESVINLPFTSVSALSLYMRFRRRILSETDFSTKKLWPGVSRFGRQASSDRRVHLLQAGRATPSETNGNSMRPPVRARARAHKQPQI